MDLIVIAGVLAGRRVLRSHERWSRPRLEAHRAKELASLLRHAYERSPFYRRFHRGHEGRPLAELPVLTKTELMASFDDLVTDRDVRLRDVSAHLEELRGDALFRDRYRVVRTSGSTGHPGIFLADRREWIATIASYSRAQEWAGILVSPARRTRLAVVSSRIPWHQSARVGMSVDSPFLPVRRFDATEPLAGIVAGLDAWQPENLVVYASMGRALAEEQLAGRLHIRPRAVMCSSEVLTEESKARIERAFGSRPFNVYAATETAGVASECRLHRLHLFEDLVIVEVVDEKNRPVPPGTFGAKILATVLFSRTQPLIRYEISDSVTLSEQACECGLPFAVLGGIQGRAEDVLSLPGRSGGSVSIHPNVFHGALEPLPVKGWQVVEAEDAIHVSLLGPVDAGVGARAAADVARALEAAGAAPLPLRVEVVDRLQRTALGKAPLIQARRPAPSRSR